MSINYNEDQEKIHTSKSDEKMLALEVEPSDCNKLTMKSKLNYNVPLIYFYRNMNYLNQREVNFVSAVFEIHRP